MQGVYKHSSGQLSVHRWCSEALAHADFPLTTDTLDTAAGHIHLTSAGTGTTRVVLVPGTGSNAAVMLPWLQALSTHWPTTVVDLPGQPGLSDPHRPRRKRLSWYGRALDDTLAAAQLDNVVLLGNSLGAAVVLAARSHRIAARALISPAGFIRLAIDPEVALASTIWLLRPTTEHTRRMLRLFVGPTAHPPERDVEWMTLMAASCHTTLAPPPLPPAVLLAAAQQPCVVGVGEYDRFLPPGRLVPVARRTMDTALRVFPGMGHLTTPEYLSAVVDLVAEVAN